MSYISRKHELFYRWLNDVDVLSKPEDYFGPNYKVLLNYWIYCESISREQNDECWNKVWALDGDILEHNSSNVTTLARQVCWREVDVMNSIEKEICAAHLILEQGESLVFLPLMVAACSSVTPA
jgi:hypothetical protein